MMSDGAGGFFVAYTTASGLLMRLYIQRMTGSGVISPGWPAAGVPVSTTAAGQGGPQMVPDGAGGVIVVWSDFRTGDHYDIYANRVDAGGTIHSGWPAGGLPIDIVNKEKDLVSICSDGAGGVLMAYEFVFTPSTDVDIYSAHVTGAASVSTGTVNTFLNIQDQPAIAPDGAGGCYVTYEDNSPGNYDIKVIRLNSSLVPVFTTKIICDHPSDQHYPQIVANGANGAVVMFLDFRLANYQLMSNYVSQSGFTGYSFGTPVYPTTDNQNQAKLFPDNSGGFYAAWVDARSSAPGLYLKHFVSHNVQYPGWPYAGVFLGPGTVYQNWIFQLATDPSNGAIVSWQDENNFSGALYGAHIDAYGTPRPLTLPAGNVLIFNQTYTSNCGLVSDGLGGGLMTWTDNHTGVGQIWAQHLDPFLVLGDAGPSIASVRDIRSDQGGSVRVTWNASWLDNTNGYGIGSYWVWRQAPLTVAREAVRQGSNRVFRPATEASAQYAWEFLAQQPANTSAQYSYVASTTTDSTAGHNPYTVFMIEAHSAADTRAFWQSVADSGYSVDNLPPSTPAPFTGTYSASSTAMQWGANHEADLAGYRLYRGSSIGFTPGPGNLIASLSSTNFTDPGAPPSIYKLTAADAHGNESVPAILVPQGVTAADNSLPTELAFSLASANPSRGATALRLALPRPARVTLSIYDIAGREVRSIVSGTLAAGVNMATWDGHDSAGGLARSGVYLARMRAEGRDFVLRLVLAR
jgi:hypothetical protein